MEEETNLKTTADNRIVENRPRIEQTFSSETPDRMSEIEAKAFKSFIDSSSAFIDPMKLANKLVSRHVIDTFNFTKIILDMKKGQSWEQIWNFLFHETKDKCSLRIIVNMLVVEDERAIVQRLYRHWVISQKESGGISTPQRVNIESKGMSRYFKNIKQQIHKLSFGNSENINEALQDLGMSIKQKIERTTDENAKKDLCDQYVSLKAAQTDYLCNTSISIEPNNEHFQEIEMYASSCTHPALALILVRGRQGDALSTTNEFSEGGNFMRSAYVEADFAEPCVEIIDMMYKNMVFKLAEFEANPTKEAQDAVIMVGDQALDKLQDKDEDLQEFWKKIILVRKTYAYLGVGKHSKIIRKYWPDDICIKQAENIFKNPLMKNLELRRHFFKHVAKARLYEVLSKNAKPYNRDIKLLYCKKAIKHINKAEDKSKQGKYSELEAVQQYKHQLKTYLQKTENVFLSSAQTDLFLKESQILNPASFGSSISIETTTSMIACRQHHDISNDVVLIGSSNKLDVADLEIVELSINRTDSDETSPGISLSECSTLSSLSSSNISEQSTSSEQSRSSESLINEIRIRTSSGSSYESCPSDYTSSGPEGISMEHYSGNEIIQIVEEKDQLEIPRRKQCLNNDITAELLSEQSSENIDLPSAPLLSNISDY